MGEIEVWDRETRKGNNDTGNWN